MKISRLPHGVYFRIWTRRYSSFIIKDEENDEENDEEKMRKIARMVDREIIKCHFLSYRIKIFGDR